jgi:uroporphyrinogen decarboxylase
MNSLQRFTAACSQKPVDRPPVWMMRQAGRTLPEYRELRAEHSFWEVCRTPDLAAEVTLQPLRRFQVDAAIIFSDILVVPAAMGVNIEFTPAPVIENTIETLSDVDGLAHPDVGKELRYVADALTVVRKELAGKRALLGFAGAPYTIACYLVDGFGKKGFVKTRAMLYENPQLMHRLLGRIADVTADYLQMQVEAGITAFQLFDSWGGDLPPEQFEQFALPYVARIVERLKGKGAFSIYYVNGIANLVEAADRAQSDILGIDWRIPLAQIRPRTAPDRVLQGNLDPTALYGPAEGIRQAVHKLIDSTGGQGHIMNLGHGLNPTTPIAGIEAFVNAVVDWKGA